MARKILTALVNHVAEGALHKIGDKYEFNGTENELRELVDGGYAATEVNLGRATVASDVKKYREMAETEAKARVERDATIAELEAKIGPLETENAELAQKVSELEVTLQTVDETAAEMRKVLGLPDDGVILTAIKELVKKASKADSK